MQYQYPSTEHHDHVIHHEQVVECLSHGISDVVVDNGKRAAEVLQHQNQCMRS